MTQPLLIKAQTHSQSPYISIMSCDYYIQSYNTLDGPAGDAFKMYIEHVFSLLNTIEPPDVTPIGRPSLDFLKDFMDEVWLSIYEGTLLIHGPFKLDMKSKYMKNWKGPIVWRFWEEFGKDLLLHTAYCRFSRHNQLTPQQIYRMGHKILETIYAMDMDDYFFKEPQDCSICLEEMFSPRKTACGHYFHKACIDKWRKKSLTCTPQTTTLIFKLFP